MPPSPAPSAIFFQKHRDKKNHLGDDDECEIALALARYGRVTTGSTTSTQVTNMNETRIRKGTIMNRTTALALLGLACLMAMPSIAHARYRDGMNLYQYVSSNPTRYCDPTGREKVGFDLQVDVTHKIVGLEGKVSGLFAPLIPALQEEMSQANRGLPLLQLTATDQFRMSDMPAGAAASLSVTGSSQQSGRISGWTGIARSTSGCGPWPQAEDSLGVPSCPWRARTELALES